MKEIILEIIKNKNPKSFHKIFKNYPHVVNFLDEKYGKNLNINEKIFLEVNDKKIEDYLCILGNKRIFVSFNFGYRRFCKRNCPCYLKNSSEKTKKLCSNEEWRKKRYERIKEETIKKYGVISTLKLDEIKEKIKKTNLMKLGVDNPAKNEHVKEKIKKTNLKKYGVENFARIHLSKETLEKLSDLEFLKKQHCELKKPLYVIANELGVSLSSISKIFKKNNIQNHFFSESNEEKEVKSFIRNLGLNVESRKRNLIPPFEIDIFVPEKNLAIEYCGLYWHSQRFIKDKNYHLKKLLYCLDQKIKLVTVFSNEWIYDKERTQQKLIWILEGNEYKLYEGEIGKDEIKVDRRWTEGKFLLDMGYKFLKTENPKKWFFDQKLDKIFSTKNETVFSSIFDCGKNIFILDR
ncbi:MAG: hypothetical protein NZZ41_02135 [Candidatus Dojkabacteria bacterium]|nr:hypothetical protein [Candidatus Dojkabacteria bacterium]